MRGGGGQAGVSDRCRGGAAGVGVSAAAVGNAPRRAAAERRRSPSGGGGGGGGYRRRRRLCGGGPAACPLDASVGRTDARRNSPSQAPSTSFGDNYHSLVLPHLEMLPKRLAMPGTKKAFQCARNSEEEPVAPRRQTRGHVHRAGIVYQGLLAARRPPEVGNIRLRQRRTFGNKNDEAMRLGKDSCRYSPPGRTNCSRPAALARPARRLLHDFHLAFAEAIL